MFQLLPKGENGCDGFVIEKTEYIATYFICASMYRQVGLITSLVSTFVCENIEVLDMQCFWDVKFEPYLRSHTVQGWKPLITTCLFSNCTYPVQLAFGLKFFTSLTACWQINFYHFIGRNHQSDSSFNSYIYANLGFFWAKDLNVAPLLKANSPSN